jgi:staphylococcal nuclease domain-containing protein 1
MFVDKQNLAVKLLEMGYSQTYKFSADKSKYSAQLYEAEKRAKDARIGVWEGWVEPEVVEEAEMDEEQKAAAAEAADHKSGKDSAVTITEIIDGVNFYITMGGNTKDANAIAAGLKKAAAAEADDEFTVHKNMICCGKFTDGEWYRVKVEKGDFESGLIPVHFIDFGNSDVLTMDKLCGLPLDIAAIQPLAKPCVLAGCKAPSSSSDYAEDAAHVLNELTTDVEVLGKVEFTGKEDKKLHLTLSTKDSPVTINQQMVRDGWLRLMDTRKADHKLKSLIGGMKQDEEAAKLARLNTWEYGDVSDDEEESTGFGGKRREDGRPPSKKDQIAEKVNAKERAAALAEVRARGTNK